MPEARTRGGVVNYRVIEARERPPDFDTHDTISHLLGWPQSLA
jgi:hypothetical protein